MMQNMPVDEAPDDEEARQTFNFAPGAYGLVYRADTPDRGAGTQHGEAEATDDGEHRDGEQAREVVSEGVTRPRYKLQAMKWGSRCLR